MRVLCVDPSIPSVHTVRPLARPSARGTYARATERARASVLRRHTHTRVRIFDMYVYTHTRTRVNVYMYSDRVTVGVGARNARYTPMGAVWASYIR